MKEIVLDTIIVEEMTMTMAELARVCSVKSDYIIELVEEGIIEPIAEDLDVDQSERWFFTGNSLQRVHVSLRLQRDLGVNLPGVVLILDMLEELR